MSRVTLAKGVNFGAPTFNFTSNAGTLDPAIYRAANSLAVFPAQFQGAAFFDGQNFTGTALVITNPGSVQDLSHSPWGNWANRIASVMATRPGLRVEMLLSDLRTTGNVRDVIVVDNMPSPPPEESVDFARSARTELEGRIVGLDGMAFPANKGCQAFFRPINDSNEVVLYSADPVIQQLFTVSFSTQSDTVVVFEETGGQNSVLQVRFRSGPQR